MISRPQYWILLLIFTLSYAISVIGGEYKTYEDFKQQYPGIKLMADLQTADSIMKMYYPKMREKVFELLTKADMKEGLINYDSDSGRMQIKDAELMRCFEISG